MIYTFQIYKTKIWSFLPPLKKMYNKMALLDHWYLSYKSRANILTWRERFVHKKSIVLRLPLCSLRTFRGFYGFHSWRVFLLRRFSSHVRVFVDQRIEEFVRLTRSGLVTALNRQRQIVCSCVFLVFDLQHLF